MWVARADDGFLFGGLTAECIETLRAVPMLLESKDERVRARLLPETYGDHVAQEQWREHAAPELERLFLSRAQLVRKDLAALRQLKSADSWVLLVPDHHVNAWLASLNAARLALFALNDLAAEHMERDGARNTTRKQQEAVARIHFLAEVQCVLLGDVDFGDTPDGPDGPDSGSDADVGV
jgi:hypothetical protein